MLSGIWFTDSGHEISKIAPINFEESLNSMFEAQEQVKLLYPGSTTSIKTTSWCLMRVDYLVKSKKTITKVQVNLLLSYQ
jgi:hypothetical protein